MSIYRKLKEYIKHEDGCTWSIFGTLMARNVLYVWNEEKEWFEWTCKGVYGYEKDYLLEYYVTSIEPFYKIEKDKIVPMIKVWLRKEIEV